VARSGDFSGSYVSNYVPSRTDAMPTIDVAGDLEADIVLRPSAAVPSVQGAGGLFGLVTVGGDLAGGVVAPMGIWEALPNDALPAGIGVAGSATGGLALGSISPGGILHIGGSLAGSVEVDGNVWGDVIIQNDIASGGLIEVGGAI